MRFVYQTRDGSVESTTLALTELRDAGFFAARTEEERLGLLMDLTESFRDDHCSGLDCE